MFSRRHALVESTPGFIFNGKNLIILVDLPKCEIFIFDIKTRREEIIESVQIKVTEANLEIKVFQTLSNAPEFKMIFNFHMID